MNKGKKRHSRSNPDRLALKSLAGLPVPVWREATSQRRDMQDLNIWACQRVMPRSYSLTRTIILNDFCPFSDTQLLDKAEMKPVRAKKRANQVSLPNNITQCTKLHKTARIS